MGRLGFKQKILFAYLLTFLVFFTLLFPLASQSVYSIVRKTFKQRVTDLISTLSHSKDLKTLVRILQNDQTRSVYKVTLFDSSGVVLYDSQTGIATPENFKQIIEGNTKYEIEDSFLFVSRPFIFAEQTFVLRVGFPFSQFSSLIDEFEIGFILIGAALLLLFFLLIWTIIHHLLKPIGLILQTIRPYQLGKIDILPQIPIGETINPKDDFGHLALTLNALSQKIQHQIEILTLEHSNQETILESLGEGVVAVDPSLTVTYANRVALEMFDCKREELLRRHFTQLPQAANLLMACQKQNTIFASSIKLPKKVQLLDILAVPIHPRKGAVLVLQDKSSQYRLLEVGKNFVANASHELKTPITIIRGFAETLQDHPDLPLATSREIVGKIVRNCERMETLIRNLLTLATIEDLPKSRLQECNLLELIENCKQLLLTVFPTALVSVKVVDKAPIHIVADSDLLELAIMNLLTNAAKYSSPPARIEITITSKGELIELAIKDHGMGIPEEDIEHIFDRFYTVDKAHSRKLGGSGLGLSITKTIVDKHQGKLTVTSRLGVGSTFLILLPQQLMDLQT